MNDGETAFLLPYNSFHTVFCDFSYWQLIVTTRRFAHDFYLFKLFSIRIARLTSIIHICIKKNTRFRYCARACVCITPFIIYLF